MSCECDTPDSALAMFDVDVEDGDPLLPLTEIDHGAWLLEEGGQEVWEQAQWCNQVRRTIFMDDVVFVVSADTPDYAQALFRAFGFEVHASDANVSGALLKMTPFKFRFRPYGVPFLRKRALQLGLVSDPNPKSGRLYIARVGRRTATNEADVSKVLEQRGFERVLAEDLTIEEQIRRIAGAEIIFAMHGAAMGFMQLRDPAQAGVVIETCSVGYTSNWARAIASRAGDTWFGMQGKWDPKHVTDLLQGAPPRTHEAASYELSVPMVEQAVTLAELTVSKGAALTADEVLAHIPPIRL